MTTGTLVSHPSRTLWRGVKKVLRPIKHTLFRPSERAANAYATHIPVLIGLSLLFDVERVLEFGCGQYSTLTFLNHGVFPKLKELKSLETDSEWLSRMAQETDGDSRVKFEHIRGRMCLAVSDIELDKYDLIFIDDSNTAEERSATISEIATNSAKTAIIVIHDFELPLYQQAAKPFAHSFKFNSLNPHTGVAWNDANISKKRLKKLRADIKRHSEYLEPDDIQGWFRVITPTK
jgi:predicted O-methyltransferase YrrM